MLKSVQFIFSSQMRLKKQEPYINIKNGQLFLEVHRIVYGGDDQLQTSIIINFPLIVRGTHDCEKVANLFSQKVCYEETSIIGTNLQLKSFPWAS